MDVRVRVDGRDAMAFGHRAQGLPALALHSQSVVVHHRSDPVAAIIHTPRFLGLAGVRAGPDIRHTVPFLGGAVGRIGFTPRGQTVLVHEGPDLIATVVQAIGGAGLTRVPVGLDRGHAVLLQRRAQGAHDSD